MELTCEQLGITKDDIADRVAANIADAMMQSYIGADEDGNAHFGESKFASRVKSRVEEIVGDAVKAVADKHVPPNVEQFLAEFRIPQTTRYGEPTRPPLTFIEYITECAEQYMREPVDREGRSQDEARGSWYGDRARTRAAHMVHKYLHHQIESAMKDALKTANEKIVGGIEAAVKESLAQIQAKIAAKVEIK